MGMGMGIDGNGRLERRAHTNANAARHGTHAAQRRRNVLPVWGLVCVLSLANYVQLLVLQTCFGPRTPPDAAIYPRAEFKHRGSGSGSGAPGDSERAVTDAVNAMRCLTTPGCFPGVKCASGDRPRQVKVDKWWEQHAFCAGDLKTTAATARRRAEGDGRVETSMSVANKSKEKGEESGRCLVYSFGLHENSQWEKKMANTFGCDVYAFDQTSNFKNETTAKCPPSSATCWMAIAEGVEFRKLGLQGDGTDVSSTHSENYDAIDPERLRTLGEIVQLLGHGGRRIDVLRLDCEGCEYGVLKQLACGGDGHLVKQIMVGFHFQRNLGLHVDDDVVLAGDAVRCLEEQRWGAVSLEQRGVGREDQAYTGAALRFIKTPLFLLYATFRRVPESEKLGWERYGEIVKKEHENFIFDEKRNLTEEEKMESRRVAREVGEVGEAWGRYEKLVNTTREAIFDKGFELVDEG